MAAKSQRMVHTKTGAVTSRRIDDHTPFSMVYNCVSHYLGDPSKNPQRMTITCGQSDIGKKILSISLNEISKQTAVELADSKHFEVAFDIADNRQSLHAACNKARRFYNEHILYRNPFPPRQRFSFVIEKSMKMKKENSKPKPEEPLITATKTSSAISLLESTMSLTSVSSHSQLSSTTPSIPIDLKSKKKSSNQIAFSPVFVRSPKALKTPPKSPPKSQTKSQKSTSQKGASEEQRLINTFNTSE